MMLTAQADSLVPWYSVKPEMGSVQPKLQEEAEGYRKPLVVHGQEIDGEHHQAAASASRSQRKEGM
jgi:hypothetical protein